MRILCWPSPGHWLRGPLGLLALGRLLSQVGSGCTFIAAPVFFAQEVGLSPLQVGIGLGLGSLAGAPARWLSGRWSDQPRRGRRWTLLRAVMLAAIATALLALARDFPGFLGANLLLGAAIGLYWPAAETLIADLTTPAERAEAFALNRFADNLGLGIGIALAGLLAQRGAYRLLFWVDAVSFLVLWLLLLRGLPRPAAVTGTSPRPPVVSMRACLRAEPRLWRFLPANVLLTMFLALQQTTLPLYWRRFTDRPMLEISADFVISLVLTVLLQPLAVSLLNRWGLPRGLLMSALLWGVGLGALVLLPTVAALVPMLIWALATVLYLPGSSAYVAAIAPADKRATYLALNSQCWGIGYLLGPPLGGWALEQGPPGVGVLAIALLLAVILIALLMQGLSAKGPDRNHR